MLFQLK